MAWPQRITTPFAAPALTVPGAQSATEDVNKAITGASASFAANPRVTVSATNGTISLAQTTGLTFTVGDGTADATMTFTGTPANVNAALATLTFIPTPNYNGAAVVTIRTAHATYANLYQEKTIAVTIAAVNDAPSVTTSGGSTTYTEGDAAVAIDAALTVADVDSSNLASGYAQITGNFQAGGEDVLSVADALGITAGAFNTTTGRIDLSGTTTVANWQAFLRTVKYQNTSENLNTSGRTVTFVVNDGTSNSTGATKGVTVVAVNDAPTVSTSGGSTAYTQNDPAVVVDAGLVVADVDDVDLEGAEVEFQSGAQTGDVLAASSGSGITVTGSGTQALALSGTATKAAYQAKLREATFAGTSSDATTRVIRFRVSDGTVWSAWSTKSIAYSAAAGASPVLSGGGGVTAYDHEYNGTAIENGLEVSDADSTNLASATVWFSSGYGNGDRIIKSVADGNSWVENGITWVWSEGSHTLTGTGAATKAEYQAQLRALKYDFSPADFTGGGLNPVTPAFMTGNRVVSLKVNDGTSDSNTITQTVSVGYYTGTLGTWAWQGGNGGLAAMDPGEMSWDEADPTTNGVPLFNATDSSAANRLKRLLAISTAATVVFTDDVGPNTATIGTFASFQDEGGYCSIYHDGTGNGAWGALGGNVSIIVS